MFTCISSIKALNRRNGNYFFDRATMRFFNSRIVPKVYGGRIFLTSEQFVPSSGIPGPRLYTVRLARSNGEIETVGPFNELLRPHAQRLARLLAPLAEDIAAEFDKE